MIELIPRLRLLILRKYATLPHINENMYLRDLVTKVMRPHTVDSLGQILHEIIHNQTAESHSQLSYQVNDKYLR